MIQFGLIGPVFFVCYVFDPSLQDFVSRVSEKTTKFFVRANVFALWRTFTDPDQGVFVSDLQTLLTLA